MANLKKFATLVFFSFFLAGCGSKLPYQLQTGKAPSKGTGPGSSTGTPPGAPSEQFVLRGVFETTDQVQIDLSKETQLPVILIFAQDICSSCIQEALHIKEHLKDKTRPPSKVHLYTVLIGSNLSDASDWKAQYQIPWQVGFEVNADLLKTYCEELTVPCTLIYVPGRGIVFGKNGLVTFEDLIQHTGPWEEP